MRSGDLSTMLARFLFGYRITLQSTTAVSPAELLLSRRPRFALDLIKPDLSRRVQKEQEHQKISHDRRSVKAFDVGDLVYARNYGSGSKWLPAMVTEVTGPVSYKVEILENQAMWRRHKDQLRKCHCNPDTQVSVAPESDHVDFPSPLTNQPPDDSTSQETATATSNGSQLRHYPRRFRKPPDRYMYVEQCA